MIPFPSLAVRSLPPLVLSIVAALAQDTSPQALRPLPTMPGPFAPGRPITFLRGPDDQTPVRAAPSAAPFTASNAAAENASCLPCHREIAEEWSASLHKKAHGDPAYQRAFAREPMPFCQGCHAPEASPYAPVPDEIAAIGVGCVTCHVSGPHVLASPKANPESAPHPVTRDAAFASASACASCHEFPFPRVLVPRPNEPMQLTITEHQASPFASLACADCHMPIVNGHKSHLFSASRDPELIRSALEIQAERSGAHGLRVTLKAGHIGHAFPTGDLFRRVRVEAKALGEDNAVLSQGEYILARHFGEHRFGMMVSRTQIGDTRLGIDGTVKTIELDLGTAADGSPISYRIVYERVEHPLSRDGHHAAVEGELELAYGVIQAPRPPSPHIRPKRAQHHGTSP